MRACTPYPEIIGDNDERVMARSGSLVGFNLTHAVWRYGFLPESESAKVHGVNSGSGFVWVLATRKTGKIKEAYHGFALELPRNFREVIEWEPTKSLIRS